MKKLKNFFKIFINKIKFFAIALFIFNLISAPVSAAIEIPGTNYTMQFDSCNYGGENYDFCDEITKKITFKNVYENPSIDGAIKQIGVTFSSGNFYYEIADPSDGVFKYRNFVADTNIAKNEEFDLTVVSIAPDYKLEECRLSGKKSCDWSIDANVQVKYCNLVDDCYWQGGSVISLKRTINIVEPVVVTPTPTPTPTVVPTPIVTPTIVPTPTPTVTPTPNLNPCIGRVDYFPLISLDNPTATYIGGYVTVNGNPDEVGKYIEVYKKSNNQLAGCGITINNSGQTMYKLITVFAQVDGNPAIEFGDELKILVNGEEYKTIYVQRDSTNWSNPDEKVTFRYGSIQLVNLNKGVVTTPTPTPTVVPTPIVTPTIVPTPTPIVTPTPDYDVKTFGFMQKAWSVNQSKTVFATVLNKSNVTAYNIPVTVKVIHKSNEVAADILELSQVKGANCIRSEYSFNIFKCTIDKIEPNKKAVLHLQTKLYSTGRYKTEVSVDVEDKNNNNNVNVSNTVNVKNISKITKAFSPRFKNQIIVNYSMDYYLYNNPTMAIGKVVITNKATGKSDYLPIYPKENFGRFGRLIFNNVEKGTYSVELYYYHQTEPIKLVDKKVVIVK